MRAFGELGAKESGSSFVKVGEDEPPIRGCQLKSHRVKHSHELLPLNFCDHHCLQTLFGTRSVKLTEISSEITNWCCRLSSSLTDTMEIQQNMNINRLLSWISLTLLVNSLSFILPGVFCRYLQKPLYIQEKTFCNEKAFTLDDL